MECRPAFDYARQPHEIHIDADGTRRHASHPPRQQFALKSTRPLERDGDGRGRRVHAGGRARRRRSRYGIANGTADERSAPKSRRRRSAAHGDRRASGGAGSRRAGITAAGARSLTRSALVLKLLTYLPDRRHCRRAHHQPAGRDRRRAQLGLSLHVGARCRVHGLLADAPRATPRRPARSRTSCRRARKEERPTTGRSTSCTASTARHDLAEETLDHLDGYRGSQPGAHRQRRLRASAARYLRRADGLALPLQQVRRAALVRHVDDRSSACSTGW